MIEIALHRSNLMPPSGPGGPASQLHLPNHKQAIMRIVLRVKATSLKLSILVVSNVSAVKIAFVTPVTLLIVYAMLGRVWSVRILMKRVYLHNSVRLCHELRLKMTEAPGMRACPMDA